MKLSTLSAKLTGLKLNVVRTLATLTLAGAALAGAAPAASAQHFAVGVQFGGPRYVAPAPVYGAGVYGPAYGTGYYGPRYDAWRAHEGWVRHEEWERFHHQPAYGPVPRPYGYRPY